MAVFLSGRPLWMNRELNAADAFVASWLPGSEGAGVADILFGDREATGRLSFSWPARCEGAPLNGPEGALFPVGFGRSLGESADLQTLPEDCGYLDNGAASEWYGNGRLAAGVTASAGGVDLPNLRGEAAGIVARGIDRERQEDAREVTFGPGAILTLTGQGEGAFRITYDVETAPAGAITLTSGGSSFDAVEGMTVAAGKGWREMVLTEACLPSLGEGLAMTSDAPFSIRIAAIERIELPEGTACSF